MQHISTGQVAVVCEKGGSSPLALSLWLFAFLGAFIDLAPSNLQAKQDAGEGACLKLAISLGVQDSLINSTSKTLGLHGRRRLSPYFWMMTQGRRSGIIPDMQTKAPIGFPKLWTTTGYLLLCGAAIFVGRIVYEETLLTWINGPQMVGFAMMHGAVPFILVAGLIGLLGGLLWVIASLVLLFRRKFGIPLIDWVPLVLLPLFAVLLFIPYETWEEFTIRIAGPGSHGGEFMVHAAAHGKQRFFMHLLHKGYDINYEAGGGVTALSGAAVEGNEEMVSLLISMGADVNRKNGSTRETPLMAATQMGKFGAAQILLKNGADPCATDKDGNTAAGLAKEYGHTRIADYLSSKFHCQEKVIDACSDPSATCVRP